MARLIVTDLNYGFDDINLEGSNFRIEGRSSTGFTVQVGNDFFDFGGTGITYLGTEGSIFGIDFDLGIDVITGGTITSYRFREDGTPRFQLDQFSARLCRRRDAVGSSADPEEALGGDEVEGFVEW